MFKQLNEQLKKLLGLFYEDNEKKFIAEYTPEAKKQLLELEDIYYDRITEAIAAFEILGTAYKNINKLGNKLFEIKPKDVRAYFKYHPDRKRIIIVGLVCLKKTQKAPDQYKKQAHKNIDTYLQKEKQNDNKWWYDSTTSKRKTR